MCYRFHIKEITHFRADINFKLLFFDASRKVRNFEKSSKFYFGRVLHRGVAYKGCMAPVFGKEN